MTIEMYEDVMNHLQIDKYRELIIKQDQKITELEKACEETQELLDKQIEATYKLDKENTELKNKLEHRNCLDCSNHSSKLRMRTLELQEENADLKCECRRCVYSDTFCIVSDYGKDRNGICDHFKDVFDENVELKAFRKDCIKLTEDNVVMARQRAEVAKQLTKAKELLRDFISVSIDYIDKEDKNYSLIEEAEQFLSEVEK